MPTIEQRVEVLEKEMADFKRQLEGRPENHIECLSAIITRTNLTLAILAKFVGFEQSQLDSLLAQDAGVVEQSLKNLPG